MRLILKIELATEANAFRVINADSRLSRLSRNNIICFVTADGRYGLYGHGLSRLMKYER